MTPPPAPTPRWLRLLEQLLQAGFDPDGPATAGAQLVVTDDTGTAVFHRPLARHVRVDDDCVWIRPIIGDGPGFDLHDSRRRGLPTHAPITATTDTITFTLADGARATIGAADWDLVAFIDRWDTYLGAQISAADEAALQALDTDTV